MVRSHYFKKLRKVSVLKRLIMVVSFTSSAGARGGITSKRRGIGAAGFKKVKRVKKKKTPYKTPQEM